MAPRPARILHFGVCTRLTKTYAPSRMFSAPVLPRRLPAPARSLCSAAALCLASLLAASPSQGQTPGQLDTSFNSASTGSTFFALTLQNPGSDMTTVTVGGDLGAFNRLDASGGDSVYFISPDFGDTGRIVYTIVQELVFNSDNEHQILVGGLFGRSATQIADKTPARNIYRLRPDAEIDLTFNPGTGADKEVTAILPLADGGMVVGGLFDLFNGQNHNHIVRLDNSGAIVPDSTFSSKLNIDDTVLSLAAQQNPNAAGPQGQFLVAGTFTHVNGDTHTSLARINADGSVDTTFNPVFSDRVRIVVSQPDGKILAGGDFETVNGVGVKHLVRLNYDGSLDTSFNARVTTQPPLIAEPVAVNTITPVGDGSYYIGGNFAQVNGIARRYLARVLADGTVDSFDPGLIITNTVQQVAVDPILNLVYVTETRSKSVGTKATNYPASIIRLYGGPPAVSLEVKQPVATEPLTPGAVAVNGKYKLKRSGGNLSQATTVYLSLSGSGAGKIGTDYELTNVQPSGNLYAATIPADTAALKIKVVPINVRGVTAPETIVLTVQPDQANPETYSASAPVSGTVTLTN